MKMLSKHTFLPTKSLFMAAGIAACGLAAVGQSANALSITLDSSDAPPNGNNYVYSVDLEPGETFTTGQTIAFSGMSDVTSATAIPGFTISSIDPANVVFEAAGDFPNLFVPGPNIGNFTISSTSTEPLGTISWATDASGTGVKSGSIGGPVAPLPPPGPGAPVPFEFSPGLGLILSGTLFGALKLRSKFSQKEEINF